ncbi:large conductance mechanosensitive channel protein MscL [Nordella sp. HKS 07]|uniref:large conductance mechanosensitive channel protein MscL n=1 Tax=Nordella sp. HKS 07 TaxID=2712222 RepID=UPI0013E1177B|nr:large conductance mechanosensitive channel protein MscL [Nordella sp. HKS 07]QIG52492.1 large conductance mechanosensitive channel protein MscL [Nordella sp. HKS 07]
MWQEFKSFALKGNAFDLAVGVIIGAAFSKIVSSIVDDLIMPIIGAFGSLDFNNYFFGLSSKVNATTLAAAKDQGPVLAYGSFLTALVNFLIVAFILFQLVKVSNRVRKAEQAAPPPAPTPTEKLLGEIRDALVNNPQAAKKK